MTVSSMPAMKLAAEVTLDRAPTAHAKRSGFCHWPNLDGGVQGRIIR